MALELEQDLRSHEVGELTRKGGKIGVYATMRASSAGEVHHFGPAHYNYNLGGELFRTRREREIIKIFGLANLY
jgi:hypothetical protein